MLSRRILFIGLPGSFLMTTVSSGLKEDGFEIALTNYDIGEISKAVDAPSSFYFCIDGDITTEVIGALTFVKDHCFINRKKIFLMGEEAVISQAIKIVGDELVWATFVRPINTKRVCERINKLYSLASEEVQKKHILVVDDSGTYLHTIKGWLETEYSVTMVNSAMNGLSFLGKRRPDLILLDFEMPVCSGPQMLEMIRAEEGYKDIPVMFLTGKGDRESISRVLALKPQGYLLKSLPKEKILEMIKNYFDSQDKLF